MRLGISLGLAAAAVALALAPPAGAVSPVPGGPGPFTYAAETLASNTDTAQIPPFAYANTQVMPNGTVIVFTPSSGTQFANILGNTDTYSNIPVTSTPASPLSATPGTGQPGTANNGICNGAGNANTVAAGPTAITCVVNSAATFSILGTAFPSAANQIPTCTASPPLPAPPVSSVPCGPGPNGNASVVFGATTITLQGINGKSPFAVSGLSALDNPFLLQNVIGGIGGTFNPTAQVYVQVTTAGNGAVNGQVPTALAVAAQNPNNTALVQTATTPATTNPGIVDVGPVVWFNIAASRLYTVSVGAATARIDLTANGLGTKFTNTAEPNNVSTAGFFGMIGITENVLLDASNGLAINSQATNFTTVGTAPCGITVGATQAVCNPNNPTGPGQNVQTNPALPSNNTAQLANAQTTVNTQQPATYRENIIQSNLTATITGNFPTVVNAFAVQGGNSTTCKSSLVAGGAVLAGVVTNGTTIVFTLPGPGTNPATNTNQGGGGVNNTEYAICLVTNGTQVIMATSAANTITAPANQMSNFNGVTLQVSESVGAAPGTVWNLLNGNTAFSTIQFNGAAYYFENVFGAANLYPSSFRVINQGTSTITVNAVLVKDNLTGLTRNTAAPGGTSVFGTVAGAGVGVPVASLQPNDATYITADEVAAALGSFLNAGSGKATVWLMSTNPAFRASMVAQSTATGDLINLQ